MIEALTQLVSGGGSSETSLSVSDLDEERKRELAFTAQYRCAECEVPEFRVDSLYLVAEEEAEEGAIPFCEECLAERGRADDADEDHRLPEPYLGRRGYLIDPDRAIELRHKKRGDVEVAVVEEADDPYDDDEQYAGTFPRRMVEERGSHPRQHLWLGYTKRGMRITEAGVKFKHLFRHTFITGATRRGKSTLAEFIMLQHAWAGFGFCVNDPHGDLVEDIKRKLPPHRRDDVVWVEPSPGEVDRIVGLNLLEVGVPKDHPKFDEYLVGTIDGIVSVFKRGDYWGNKMGGIVENLLQGMILSETQYTLVDLHSILLDQERRQEFAAKIVEEGHWFVARYTKDIAEMDSDDLDALIRRVNKWIQYRITREIVAHKESSVSIGQAVREGKLILVKNNVGSPDIQRMITTAIVGKIDREIRKRDDTDPTKPDRDPFFLLIDELDDVLTEEMNIEDLLANAGKFGLGVILMTQYPSKVPSDVVSAAKMNCQTFISFAMPDPDEAVPIAKKYECDSSLLTSLGSYQAAVQIEINGQLHGPLTIQTFPPQPATRTPAEATEWIEEPSLDDYGVERLSDKQIWYDSLDDHASGIDENRESDRAQRDDGLTQTQIGGMRAAYDTSVRHGKAGGPLPIADVLDKLHDYTGIKYDDPNKAWREVYQDIPKTQVGFRHAEDDEEPTQIIIKDRPWLSVGNSPTSGGQKHQSTMADAYVPLSQLGFVVDVLDQSDGDVGEAMPDAIARLDDVLDLDHIDDPGEYADEVNSFRESDEYGVLARLAGTKDAYIESEHTTTDSQPSQAVKNAIEAHKDGHRCLFLCRPELAEKLHGYLAAHPKGCSSHRSTDGEDHYYTKSGTALSIDGEDMTRPGTTNNVWCLDTETGQYILRDDSGTEHARFDTPTEIFNDASAYPDGGERNVLPPVIPDHELNGDSMADIEWDIIEVPYRADVDPEFDPDDPDDEPRKLTPLDLQLYQHNAENIRLIDLDTTDKRTSTQGSVNVQAVSDAIDNAAGLFAQND